MRLAFTGPRRVPSDYHAYIRGWVDGVAADGDEFTTGACIGWDALVAHHLLDTRLGNARHRLVVPADRSRVDPTILARFKALIAGGHPEVLIEYMPPGTSYRQRNVRLLSYSDELVAGAEYPEDDGRSRRSGSWMTVRLARDASKHVRGPLVLSEFQVPA